MNESGIPNAISIMAQNGHFVRELANGKWEYSVDQCDELTQVFDTRNECLVCAMSEFIQYKDCNTWF